MKTVIRNRDEGEQRWFFGGGVHTWKVFAEETEGAMTVFEDNMVRGKTTPLHCHPESDEIIIVLEGEILAYANGEPQTVRGGEALVNPRGVPPAIVVTSARARLIAISTPGVKTEAFYRGASIDATDGPVDFTKIAEAAKATGATVILGPPPFTKP